MKTLISFTLLTSSLFAQATIPCLSTPGNTVGVYRQQCLTSAKATFVCSKVAGCSLASDWITQSLIDFSTGVRNRTADQLTYTAPGVGSVARTTQQEFSRIFRISQYDTQAHAQAAADSAGLPLVVDSGATPGDILPDNWSMQWRGNSGGAAPALKFWRDGDGSMAINREIRLWINSTDTYPPAFGCSGRDNVATARCLATDITTDAYNEFSILINGKMAWGPGTTGQDTFLSRPAPYTLATEGTFRANGKLLVGGGSIFPSGPLGNFQVHAGGLSNQNLVVDGNTNGIFIECSNDANTGFAPCQYFGSSHTFTGGPIAFNGIGGSTANINIDVGIQHGMAAITSATDPGLLAPLELFSTSTRFNLATGRDLKVMDDGSNIALQAANDAGSGLVPFAMYASSFMLAGGFLTIGGDAGTGNAAACFDPGGKLYRATGYSCP